MSPFFKLPRELRDIVYVYYVRGDGYMYNFRSNKLVSMNGEPIDLSLAYTCRQIAEEMRGVALGENTIQFSTYLSEETRIPAGVVNQAVSDIALRKTNLLWGLAPRLLTHDVAQVVTTRYPQFQPLCDRWLSEGHELQLSNGDPDWSQECPLWISKYSRTYWGEPRSIWEDFVHFTLQLMSEHLDFIAAAKRWWSLYARSTDLHLIEMVNRHPRPWAIFDSNECDALALSVKSVHRPCPIYTRINYSYSAASLAIRFLDSMPATSRKQIRNIRLLEDHESVANSPCHTRGLIPFCQESSRLRIERVVNLWTTGFEVDQALEPAHYYRASPALLQAGLLDNDGVPANRVTQAVSRWISEALALKSLGMPDGSFKLVLDGSPLPQRTSEIFRVVQRDTTFQEALDVCYDRGLLPYPSWFERRLRIGYIFEGLPQAMKMLLNNASAIHCNFALEAPVDVEEFLNERVGWNTHQWDEDWKTREPSKFQTEPPLPAWHILRWKYVHPCKG